MIGTVLWCAVRMHPGERSEARRSWADRVHLGDHGAGQHGRGSGGRVVKGDPRFDNSTAEDGIVGWQGIGTRAGRPKKPGSSPEDGPAGR